jgi:hypothetical protein
MKRKNIECSSIGTTAWWLGAVVIAANASPTGLPGGLFSEQKIQIRVHIFWRTFEWKMLLHILVV